MRESEKSTTRADAACDCDESTGCDARDSTITNSSNQMDSVFFGGFPTDIRKKYHIMDDVLGEGSFGTVRKCRLLGSNLVCALKTIDKSKLPDATQLRREVEILLDVDHPHIIKLYDVYETETVSRNTIKAAAVYRLYFPLESHPSQNFYCLNNHRNMNE